MNWTKPRKYFSLLIYNNPINPIFQGIIQCVNSESFANNIMKKRLWKN